ncbi:MAG: hypothetical protein SWH78_18055 [Thermodesulfobacteriota bacterium]|nr:hypothetical protein [Thermodesulfobacteriota bacterium]
MKARTIIVAAWGIMLFSLMAGAPVLADEVVVIANQSVVADSVTQGTVSDIYTGSKTRWEDGETIRVAMLKEGRTHETFVQDLLGSTPDRLKNFWVKAVFTGIGTPPKVFKTEADLVKYVAGTRGAIGYVGSSIPHEGVKALAVR